MKKILQIVLFVLCPLAAFAQGGSEAMPFVRTEMGPLYTATAGAAVASPDAGAWAAFRSAAALAMSDCVGEGGIEGRYAGGFPGAGAAFSVKPMGNLGIAVGAFYHAGDVIGDFRTGNILLSAGASYGVTDYLSIGLNTRLAKQNLAEGIAYNAVSADVSVMGKISDAFYATAGASALGGKVTSASGSQYPQPGNIYVGVEYRKEAFDGVFFADAMAEFYFSGAYAAALGGGFTYNETVSFKCGLRYASVWCVIPTTLSAGISYHLGDLSLNATYLRQASLNIVTFGIGYKFK